MPDPRCPGSARAAPRGMTPVSAPADAPGSARAPHPAPATGHRVRPAPGSSCAAHPADRGPERRVARRPYLLAPHSPPDAFPDPSLALDVPNGLLAAGGDLGPERLLYAYRRGIFPWFGERQPILWWSPDPRAVLWPADLHVSRSLRRTQRRATFAVSTDTAFDRVVHECAAPRPGRESTWITPEMAAAYGRLHHAGYAHSIECWHGSGLAGGLYGIAIGRVFFGESMFSRAPDASKIALAHLCTLGFELIDCQVPNAHLARLGAVEVSRRRFLALLDGLCEAPGPHAFGDGRAGSGT